jgi:transposase
MVAASPPLLDLRMPPVSCRVVWLTSRGPAFKKNVKEATLDPFTGYKRAIDDHLEDAVAILDAFHCVKLGTTAVDEVRRRIQQQIHGHRGRKGDPLYGIRNILRAGVENLTEKQRARLEKAVLADPRHDEVYIAWQCAQQLRAAYATEDRAAGRRIAEQVLKTFPTCPIPEIKRLGKTLTRWRAAFLAYWDTGRANNGPTEALNGLIELHRRIARGIPNPDHYRLHMLLIGGGLRPPPPELRRARFRCYIDPGHRGGGRDQAILDLLPLPGGKGGDPW